MKRGEVPLCVDSSNTQLNRYLGIQLQLIDPTRVNNKTVSIRKVRYQVYGLCSTWRMGVSDDESYDNRCDESTNQGLNCGPKPLTIDPEDGEKIEHT